MVVQYGNKKIQMPTDNTDKRTVYVKKENGKYTLVDKLYEIRMSKNEKQKKVKVTETDLVDDVTVNDEESSK
jgi:hypothetical protein